MLIQHTATDDDLLDFNLVRLAEQCEPSALSRLNAVVPRANRLQSPLGHRDVNRGQRRSFPVIRENRRNRTVWWTTQRPHQSVYQTVPGITSGSPLSAHQKMAHRRKTKKHLSKQMTDHRCETEDNLAGH
jgi:hypothetical protein